MIYTGATQCGRFTWFVFVRKKAIYWVCNIEIHSCLWSIIVSRGHLEMLIIIFARGYGSKHWKVVKASRDFWIFCKVCELFTKESTILVCNIFIRTRFVHLKTELNSYKLTSLIWQCRKTHFIRVPAKMAKYVTAVFRLFVLVLGVLLGCNEKDTKRRVKFNDHSFLRYVFKCSKFFFFMFYDVFWVHKYVNIVTGKTHSRAPVPFNIRKSSMTRRMSWPIEQFHLISHTKQSY